MNQQRPAFYYELCRLCLEAEGIYDIFETDNLLQDIYACTGIIIYVSEQLPHKVCNKCIDFIRHSNEFRMFVKQNDLHLRSILNGGTEINLIKTIAYHSPKEASIATNTSEEVTSAYFENGYREDIIREAINHMETEPSTQSNNESFLHEDTVVVNTISLRKDLFHPSSTTCLESSEQTNAEIKGEDPCELLEEKVKIEHFCEKVKTKKETTDSTDYVCGICSKIFVTPKKLYYHQKLHNKTIVCPEQTCGKKFATKGDLEKHVRTHTGERPFVCVLCKRGFTQRVTLRHHVRTIHPTYQESELVQSIGHADWQDRSHSAGLSLNAD